MPDQALPEPTPGLYGWLGWRDYGAFFAGYDELIRTYPDYFEAHEDSAWIRATCSDPHYRNGKFAVVLHRACELTNWKDTEALGCLAAAFAETGDFAEAVKWQQKVMALTATDQVPAFHATGWPCTCRASRTERSEGPTEADSPGSLSHGPAVGLRF